MSKFIHFDIMQEGRYLCTMHMPHCGAFKVDMLEVVQYVEDKRPSLKGKDYNIYLTR